MFASKPHLARSNGNNTSICPCIAGNYVEYNYWLDSLGDENHWVDWFVKPYSNNDILPITTNSSYLISHQIFIYWAYPKMQKIGKSVYFL
jgi:hypothetical protein